MVVDMFGMVKDFHRVFDIGTGLKPEFPPRDIRDLRVRLLEEEFNEYLDGEEAEDLQNVAKELADIIYIACGTAVSYGIPLDKVFERVHSSNMAKLVDGKVQRRDDGKVIKPEGWQPPNIEDLIQSPEVAP